LTVPFDVTGMTPPAALASWTLRPQSCELHIRTLRDDHITLTIPPQDDLAPMHDRPTIYLDQRDWSTLTHAMHDPARIASDSERAAATRLVELAQARRVILPLSAAHMTETCKQADYEPRYRRAVTLARLSAGWQLRDPLALRRFELRQAFTTRYRGRCLLPPAAVTLEPGAIHAAREMDTPAFSQEMPAEFRWAGEALRSALAVISTLLDADHVPVVPQPGWTQEFQRFADFLRENQTGKEMKRRRTHARFLADLRPELAEEALNAGISPEQMSDWTRNHSETELQDLPALGLFREVLHEKLSDPKLRWEDNDITDMMYLTAGAAYCDHIVGERRHISYIDNAVRRLDRPCTVHHSLDSLVREL
jgi:hypothetical protein